MSSEEPGRQSVRIELVGEVEFGRDPEGPVTSGSPSWPIITGLLVCSLLVLAFLVLRPAEDEAADGTQRTTPPTTTSAPSTTSSVEEEEVEDELVATSTRTDAAPLTRAREVAQEIGPLNIVPVAGLPERQPGISLGAFVQNDAEILLEDILRSTDIVEDDALDITNSSPAFGECVAETSSQTTPGFRVLPVGGEIAQAFAGNASNASITELADGRVAVIDRGTAGLSDSCDAAGGFFVRQAGLVILDPSVDQARVFPAPTLLAHTIEQRNPVEILGEVPIDQSRSHMLISGGGLLWSVDTGTGAWTMLTDPENPNVPYILSESGNRLVASTTDSFELIDVLVTADGSLAFAASISPIVSSISSSIVADGFVSFADDEFLYLSEGENTYQFAVPPPIAASEPVVAAAVESPSSLISIVLTDRFIGLVDDGPSAAPQLLQSPDGLFWRPFETTITGVDDGALISWLSLTESPDGLAVSGFRGAPFFSEEIAISDDGVSWDALTPLSTQVGDEFPVSPVAVTNDAIVVRQLVTAVEPSDNVDRACTSADVTDLTFGEELLFLNSESDTDAGVTSGGVFVRGSFRSPSFFSLGDERVGIVDVGSPFLQVCEDGRLLTSRAPGIVVIDGATGENLRFPARTGLADALREQVNTRILGEVGSGNRTHLIVAANGVLWGINEVTSEWIALSERFDELNTQTRLNAQWSASADPNRFYGVTANGVVVFDVLVDGSDEIRAEVRSARIVTDSSDTSLFDGGRILHANDKLIFFDDGRTVWRVELTL